MATGALTPWLEREFLSQRNKRGHHFPSSQLTEPKRVQLITATGTSIEEGEQVVWTEVADGALWIHCCIPQATIDQFNNSNAKPFSSYSATKGLFRLLAYRFVLAQPLIPAHSSPRKASAASTSPRLRSKRVCLRVDELKLYSPGQEMLQGDYLNFRKDLPAGGAPDRNLMQAKERVEWVKRIEEGVDCAAVSKQEETTRAGEPPKVEFLQDLQGASDPKPLLPSRNPSPPPAPPPAPAPFFPIASTSAYTPLVTDTAKAPIAIPSVRNGVPPYRPLPSWPADDQPIGRIEWREEGEEELEKRRTRRSKSASEETAGVRAQAQAQATKVKVEQQVEGVVAAQQQQQRSPKEKEVELSRMSEGDNDRVAAAADEAQMRPEDAEEEEEEEAQVELLLLGGTAPVPSASSAPSVTSASNSPSRATGAPTDNMSVDISSTTSATAVPHAQEGDKNKVKVDWTAAADQLQQRQQQQQQRAPTVRAKQAGPPTFAAGLVLSSSSAAAASAGPAKVEVDWSSAADKLRHSQQRQRQRLPVAVAHAQAQGHEMKGDAMTPAAPAPVAAAAVPVPAPLSAPSAAEQRKQGYADAGPSRSYTILADSTPIPNLGRPPHGQEDEARRGDFLPAAGMIRQNFYGQGRSFDPTFLDQLAMVSEQLRRVEQEVQENYDREGERIRELDRKWAAGQVRVGRHRRADGSERLKRGRSELVPLNSVDEYLAWATERRPKKRHNPADASRPAVGPSQLFREPSPASPASVKRFKEVLEPRTSTTTREDSIFSQDAAELTSSELSAVDEAYARRSSSVSSPARGNDDDDEDHASRAAQSSQPEDLELHSTVDRSSSVLLQEAESAAIGPSQPQPTSSILRREGHYDSSSPRSTADSSALIANGDDSALVEEPASSPASSAPLENPFPPWTGTQSLDEAEQDLAAASSEDVKMASAVAERAAPPAPSASTPPPAASLVRAGTISARRATVTSTSAVTASIQDLGETLLDSSKLVVQVPSEPEMDLKLRKGPVTWHIKPELFDFGLWCRANGVTAA
ncbi:hypothetical protein JCM10908_005938 [Rhodotorula pacifica]|uniref:uncharacterized protein n=1 Tax=Rhodotorula pacifica TaxID=1495444 RepID=UPI0031829C94